MRLFRRPPRRTQPAGRHARVLSVATVPGAAATLVATAATTDPLYAEIDEASRAESPSAVPSPSVTMVPSVTLGFADGASVELEADDPRVRTFRAAAEALLDAPRA